MKKMLFLTMACLIVGCKAVSPLSNSSLNPNASLIDARKSLTAGELYQARKITETFLQAHPYDAEGQKLMAEILDQEVSRYKEAFETKFPEELGRNEKASQAKTWLERARALLAAQEYDEAAAAAESVFQYDPGNQEASKLLDEIKNRAWTEGKKEISSQGSIIHSEVEDRVSLYKRQARVWIEEGKLGAARLAVEKILMLQPEDEEAHQLLRKIRTLRHD